MIKYGFGEQHKFFIFDLFITKRKLKVFNLSC